MEETVTGFLHSAVLVSEKIVGEIFPESFKQLYRVRSILRETEGLDLSLRASQMSIILYISWRVSNRLLSCGRQTA